MGENRRKIVMRIKRIGCEFSVCKVADFSQVDLDGEYCFVGKTDEERSLVCRSECVPGNVLECENGWRAFRIEGVLDFSLIGILAEISALLAERKIGIFAVSTYNTDYIFTKKENFERAVQALEEAGYQVV